MKPERAKIMEAVRAARAEAKEIEEDLLGVERVMVFWQEQDEEPSAEVAEQHGERLLEIQAKLNGLTSRLAAIYFMGTGDRQSGGRS